jgi:hypothetical protein
VTSKDKAQMQHLCWMYLAKYTLIGSCLSLLALAWIPLWQVEPPDRHTVFDGTNGATLWTFLRNLPEAVNGLFVHQSVEKGLIWPTVYLEHNVIVTFLVILPGTVPGAAKWLGHVADARR